MLARRIWVGVIEIVIPWHRDGINWDWLTMFTGAELLLKFLSDLINESPEKVVLRLLA